MTPFVKANEYTNEYTEECNAINDYVVGSFIQGIQDTESLWFNSQPSVVADPYRDGVPLVVMVNGMANLAAIIL